MLTKENLKNLIKKYQTNEKNVIREYVQHLFLSNLYKIKGSERLLFKGGTAIRIIFESPRFSEDLDFTGLNIYSYKEIDDYFLNALTEIEKIGINISYKEAKKTSGGYLGLIHYNMFDFSEDMKFEVSIRKGKTLNGELASIVSEFTSPYTLIYLSEKFFISEKIEALLSRKKPRDYYDLYFMLRHKTLNKYVNKNKLKFILQNLENEKFDFKRELSIFLPVSHHLILKDFKKVLKKEIEMYV